MADYEDDHHYLYGRRNEKVTGRWLTSDALSQSSQPKFRLRSRTVRSVLWHR
jgi:hypothetical protein